MVRVLTSRDGPSASLLDEVARMIRAGGLLAVPTESSYALCVSPYDASAVDRVCALKGGREHKPILVLIGTLEQVPDFVDEIPEPAKLLMNRYWPGPLTIVLPARAAVPHRLTAGSGTVGIRLSAFRPLTSLLAAAGPLTGTSANRTGEQPLMTAEQVVRILGDDLDAVFDLGPAGGDRPSTIVAVRGTAVSLVREGPISREDMQGYLAASKFPLV